MKRLLFRVMLLCLALSLFACGTPGGATPDRLKILVQENADLFLAASRELLDLHRDRAYAVLEEIEPETETGKDLPISLPSLTKLVWYVKKSDDHKDFDAPHLERILREFPFVLAYLQTDVDGRRVVIFSCGQEKDTLVRGVYYSLDGDPAGWWGRKAALKKNKERWMQLQEDGAYYYTLAIQESFYFFEKKGNLIA